MSNMKSVLCLPLIGAVLFAFSNPACAADTLPASPSLTDETNGYVGKPYGGQPQSIPGVIQAEHYDVAPGDVVDGITFHYQGQARKSDFRPTADGIGLAQFGKGHVTVDGSPEDPTQVYLGWTQTGEWMKYSVHVTASGTYRIGGHFAAAATNAKLSVTFSPALKTGPFNVPTTAGRQPGVEVYHVWERLDDLAEITLPTGDYVMTLKLEEAGGLNIDCLSFTPKP